MTSKAYSRFEKKIADIEYLLDIHTDVADSDKGRRKTKLRVLHKSAIVLLTAC